MQLNTLKPATGSKKTAKRVGRGIGCGNGKTAGRGHKGQSSRAGGYHKTGFEGGQMPLQRRLPKRGFKSQAKVKGETAEIRLSELNSLPVDVVDLLVLKQAGFVSAATLTAKVILSGEITRGLTLNGIAATKGARAAIEAAGGKFVVQE